MTILGRGDLAPQRRQPPYVRWLVAGLVLLLLAGGGYAAFAGLTGGSSKPKSSPLPLCPLPTVVPTHSVTVPARGVRLVVDNATLRPGLAAGVATELTHRGFHVTSVGNTPTTMKTGVATVHYSGAAHRLAAFYVAAQVPGATVATAGQGPIRLDLGPGFRHLATARDARIAYVRALPAPSPTPTPTTSPTCRRSPGPGVPSG